MSNYSNDAASVRVDFFKPSGKWYCTEAVKWPEGLYYAQIGAGQYNLIHDAFRIALDEHFGERRRLDGMTAICLEPFHEQSHPISLVVGEESKPYKRIDEEEHNLDLLRPVSMTPETLEKHAQAHQNLVEARLFERVDLGAYQSLGVFSHDLGEQYTKSGDESRTAIVKLTTSMDEPFVNRTVTAYLSENAQREIIAALQRNLDGEDLGGGR